MKVNKTRNTPSVFGSAGEAPVSASFVRPSASDVWSAIQGSARLPSVSGRAIASYTGRAAHVLGGLQRA